jgi:hypothetical protein
MLRRIVIAAALAAPVIALAQPQMLSNRWDSDQPTTFRHTLEGTPGRKTLRIDAVTSAGGGETVAVYPAGPGGERGKVRILFVIATTQGHSRTGTVTLPQPARGEAFSRLPIVVVVENASGRRNSGEYTLTLAP